MPVDPEQIEADDYDRAFTKRIRGDAIREPVYGSRKLKKLILENRPDLVILLFSDPSGICLTLD